MDNPHKQKCSGVLNFWRIKRSDIKFLRITVLHDLQGPFQRQKLYNNISVIFSKCSSCSPELLEPHLTFPRVT